MEKGHNYFENIIYATMKTSSKWLWLFLTSHFLGTLFRIIEWDISSRFLLIKISPLNAPIRLVKEEWTIFSKLSNLPFSWWSVAVIAHVLSGNSGDGESKTKKWCMTLGGWCMTVKTLLEFSRTCFNIWDALRDLIPFVQFRKREKHPWRSVTFSKVADLKLQLYEK